MGIYNTPMKIKIPDFTIAICSNRSNQQLPRVPVSLPAIIIKQVKFSNLEIIHAAKNLTIIISPNHGLSLARNLALQTLNQKPTPYICFTDDDCVISQDYITAIANSINSLPRPQVIFGRTLPYQPKLHVHEFCPATFTKKFRQSSSFSLKHWETVGIGNNMIVALDIFSQIGTFKPWLGAGSLGLSGEDAELIIRCLIAGIPITYDPKIIIYHNKWLTPLAARKQDWLYTAGGIAAYGFYVFQGVRECEQTFKFHIQASLMNIQSDLITLIWSPWQIIKRLNPIITKKINPHYHIPNHTVSELLKATVFHFYAPFMEIAMILRGLLIAFIYAKIIPIPEKENVVRRYYHQPK